MLYPGLFTPWLSPQTRKKTSELRDRILEDDDVQELWREVLVLSSLLVFSSSDGENIALEILEGFFGLRPIERGRNNILVWKDTKYPIGYERTLELILHYSTSAIPSNVPWILLGDDTLRNPKFDATKAEFFQLDNWTNTEWIASGTDYKTSASYVAINSDYDPHQWKDSSHPWTHAICARLLCNVPTGQVPSREATEEAFQCVDTLFTQLPKRKNPHNAEEEWPHCHIFPLKVYFLLAIQLRENEKARSILELAMTRAEFGLDGLLEIPATYEILALADGRATFANQPVSTENLAFARACVTKALASRKEHGPQELFPGVPWPDLLRRFSEAAFELHAEEYADVESHYNESIVSPEKASDILLPPISQERIAEIEAKLGPLPQDLKEMALVANGFLGSWHLFGGGFAGIDKLEFEHPSEYETYLGVELPFEEVRETVTNADGTTRTVIKRITSIGLSSSSGKDWGPVYSSYGAVENDNFNHLICPPATWKMIREAQGKQVIDGEYRVCYYANWTGGTGECEWRSMRHWVASMTAGMERELGSLEESAVTE